MTTAFRAAVMLSVLVGLPTAWIYYGPLPPEAQRVVDRLVTVAKEATGWAQEETAPPAKWDYTKSAPVWAPEASAGSSAPLALPVAPPRLGLVGASENDPAMADLAPAPVAAKTPTFAERVEPLLVRLRALGVAEYALERWGDGGKLYRFRCEMPLGASAELTQQFEAVAADPQASVEQVVAEVSSWRLAQRAGGM